jgi:hypothetical protein
VCRPRRETAKKPSYLAARFVARSWAGVIGFVGWTSAVGAEPATHLALSWSAPPGCPTAENVQARVDSLLGDGAGAGSVADVRATGQVERVDSGYRLLLTMGVGSTPSSRVIEGRTCDELAGAAAIAIALLARSSAEGVSEPSTTDGPPTASAPDRPENPPSAPSSKPDRASNEKDEEQEQETPAKTSPAELHLIIDAPIGLASWGSLPSAGLGLGAAVGIRWKTLRVTARGELWLPQTNEVSGFASRFTLQSGGAEACLIQAVSDALELGPCLGASVQRLTGEGLGSEVFSSQSRTVMWVSGTGGLFASLPTPGFAHLRFFGAASVVVSPRRPRFVIDQLGPVHEPALAAPRLDLGCEWIF